MLDFLDILRCILCCEEDGSEEREYSRYEVLPQRSSSPPRFVQRSPAIQSVQPRYIYGSDYWNQTPVSSIRVEPARESWPKPPDITPIRIVIPSPSPSVSQKKIVDSNCPASVSFPFAPSVSEPPKRPSSPYGSDLPKKPTALSGSDSLKKPSKPIGSDLPNKPYASSGSDSPIKPSASSGFNPQKKPLGSPNLKSESMIPVYTTPKDIKDLIERDKIPEVLKRPLSPSTYADYFAALLYAEDYYVEKWDVFLKESLLSGVTLRLHEETTSEKSRKSGKTVYMDHLGKPESNEREKKVYVEFDIDSIPEKRPFLLSKDYVYIRRSGKNVKPFQGFVSRVMKSKYIQAEFGKDFHSQHSSMFKYDVSFSFNRVCLKRSHQAVAASIDPSFRSFLFPERLSRSRCKIPTFTLSFNQNINKEKMSAVYQILGLKGPPPYLLVGVFSTIQEVINEAVFQIYRTFSDSRTLIIAPQNRTCDLLMRGLKNEIPDSEMFRANAAFRERDDVPDDILSSSLYERECFTCPSPQDLSKFKVIVSTFMSSFRLFCHGISAGHFSHIFVVDACSVTEPETMVALANLADKSTAVVLAGSYNNYAGWVRSDIARRNGLRRSYFRRLLESEPYSSRDPAFVTYL